jgi:hypothetical protein
MQTHGFQPHFRTGIFYAYIHISKGLWLKNTPPINKDPYYGRQKKNG